LPCNPEIALLGIYPKDKRVLIHKGTCAPKFIAALSTIAKLWKEPKYALTNERIKKMWFINTMKYYLAMRKNEVLPFATTWMELEGIMLREISQSEKGRHLMFSLICRK
ncbi:LORF2 protein, partial [Crocuta crocuta]